jgi:hypothetical protein
MPGELDDLDRQRRQLAAQILELGFIQQGTVVSRHTYCRTPGCRCHADPPQPHGPYWQWTRYQSGKTITRRLSERQARIYQEWMANRRRLAEIVQQLEELGARAAELVLQDPES